MATLDVWCAASALNVLSDAGFRAALLAYSAGLNPSAPNITGLNVQGGSSGALARQMLTAANPPDVFLPASNQDPINVLTGAIPPLVTPANVVPLLRNNLVLIGNSLYTPSPAPGPINSFAQVTAANTVNQGVQVFVANPGSPYYVPAGVYAQAAFEDFDPDIWNDNNNGGVANFATIATMEDVTMVLNSVINATTPPPNPVAAPAIGAVYATDAASQNNKVKIIAIAPPTVDATIIYPVAPVNTGTNKAGATEFINFVQTPAAMTFFTNYGFFPY